MLARRAPLALGLSLCLASLVVTAAAAAPVPGTLESVTAVEGIEELRLSNGMRILLFPDPSKQTTTVNITYLVGSRHEGAGEMGMAHLLEHMVFKGSTNHPNIAEELTSHGSRPNGSTWYDRTNYFETFAASPENLEWALDLEADRMVNSFIKKEDLESEMTVVRNEFEMGENSPQGVLTDRVLSTAYLWHAHGRSTIGARSDIEKVPIENLQAFYRKWYQPDNAVLVVAGNFDRTRALTLIQSKFGKIPKPTRLITPTWTEEPAQDGERSVTLRRVGDARSVQACYHVPAGSHPDFAAVKVLAEILGDTPSGRLHEALVETGKATSVGIWPGQFHDPGFFIVFVDARKDADIEPAKKTMLEVVERAGAKPPTDEELARAKQGLLKSWDQTMRNSEWAAISLSEWAGRGDWRLIFLDRDRIAAVTAADVQRVAATYLRPVNRTLGVYEPTDAPDRAPVPPVPDVQAMVASYKGGAGMAVGEAFDTTPDAIEKRVTRRTLGNGMELVLLPKETRDNAVVATLVLAFGDEAGLQDKGAAPGLVGGMLMRGTTTRTREQIKDELDALKATAWIGGGASSASGSVMAQRDTLAQALRIFADVAKNPSFPAAELEMLRQENLLGVEDSRRDPQQVAWLALSQHVDPWPPSDPRHANTPDESLANLRAAKLADLKAFHQTFYGANHARMAIVGDFDPAAIEPLVAELFGGWSSKAPQARLVSQFRDVPAIDTMIEVPDKEGAVFLAHAGFSMTDDHADLPALELASFMTGGGFLSSRLATRLRQEDGLCYGVGAWLGVPHFGDDASLGGYAIYAPQNAAKLEAGFREELSRIVARGFTAEEVAQAKTGWLQERRVSRSQDQELAGTLLARQDEDRTLAWDRDFEAAVAALTPEQIHAAVKRHLSPAKMSVVQAGSFAAAKPEAAIAAKPEAAVAAGP